MENMLSIIEMLQFKTRIFEESLHPHHRDNIEKSMRNNLAKHFLEIPSKCPKSYIVYPDGKSKRRYKSMVYDIYLKYIRKRAQYEIDISFQTREDLTELIANRQKWLANPHFDKRLNL